MQVGLALHGRQVDHAELAHGLGVMGIGDAGFLHRAAGLFHDAADAGLAHEHVVRFLGEHEPGGAGERIEARLRQRL